MSALQIKDLISNTLKNFSHGTIKDNAIAFFNALGYDSQKRIDGDTPDEFIALLDGQKFHETNALFNEWQSVSLLFQLTDEEMSASGDLFSVNQKIDNTIIESYLFFAITLQEKSYSRTALSKITREINKLFHKPVLVLFKHGETLTLAIINRRLHKRDESKDVLEKVILIKDIDFNQPHRAHVEILCDFSLEVLRAHLKIDSFVALHQAWEKVLDTSELNKRFFKEIADWYFWAVQLVTFPKEAGDDETRNHISVIRLITRLIFVWFLKERGLIPATLFNKSLLDEILYYKDVKGSTYYKAILQNLFFATLNQEMNTLDKPHNRKFRDQGKNGQRDQHYMVHNVYRYEGYFRNAKDAFDVFFANIPFLNGGLFECLDKKINGKETLLRIDGFSERTDNVLCVPDFLFFTDIPQTVDLNAAYGTKNKKYQVQGIINIFNRYKFTIAENTPIEEEIALDPELLGKVFENLLAAYNPETGTTARKQTGSFYTPREIVNYMVDESLIAYLETQLGKGSKNPQLNTQLRTLVGYNEENHGFNEDEVQQLIRAIDQIKMLDPACGSGAFPMGGLHKLVSILSKLDPNNARWKEQQIAKAKEIPDSTFRDKAIEDIEQAFTRNELDYGRKLYLIQNGIFGIDIQPIAVQIAKLRFFISLLVDQKINESRENRGVRPLPNLETKFVAANTLIGLEKPKQAMLRNLKIEAKEKELAEVRASHFTARTPKTKNKYRERDQHIRAEISELLLKDGFPRDTTERLAKWNPYDQNASADFFDAEWMFGVSDGFDVVIGNPPYVRQEKIIELKPIFQKQYSCYTGIADLYVYFYERGFQLLKEKGLLTFISSNKYFRAGYGKKLRAFLSSQTTVHQLIDFGDAPVFTAIAYPSIVILEKSKPNEHHSRTLSWKTGQSIENFDTEFQTNSFLIAQKELTADGWRLELPTVLRLLEKLRRAGKPLGEYVNGRFYRGVLTGFNEAFVVDRTTRDQLIAEHPSSAELLKPFLRGRDVKRWRIENPDLWLCYVGWKISIEKYPAIYKHLKQFETKLKARPEVKQGRVPWYALSRYASDYWQEFEQPKIVYPNICKRNEFALDEEKFYINQKAFIILRASKHLLGILNSNVVKWLFTKLLAKLQNGFYEPSAIFMKNFPIPKNEIPNIDILVEKILTTKRTNPKADTSALEAEIDQLVYQLYGLTEEEIKIVEEQ